MNIRKLAVMAAAALVATLGTAVSATVAQAHGDHAPIDPNMQVEDRIEAIESDSGRMGASPEVTRTVDVTMEDMRFSPAALTFTPGQTVRILLHNNGSTAHEFFIGSAREIQEHADMMKRFPDMAHNDPSARRLKPGQSIDLLWQFTKAGHFMFACMLPGHLEAGMTGTIDVTAAVAAPTDVPAAAATANAPAATDNFTHGEVLKVDAAQGKVTIRHGAIRNLDMPGMTMTFPVADPAMLTGITAGNKIDFVVEIVAGNMVITRLQHAP